jgi:hypothetical protein
MADPWVRRKYKRDAQGTVGAVGDHDGAGRGLTFDFLWAAQLMALWTRDAALDLVVKIGMQSDQQKKREKKKERTVKGQHDIIATHHI